MTSTTIEAPPEKFRIKGTCECGTRVDYTAIVESGENSWTRAYRRVLIQIRDGEIAPTCDDCGTKDEREAEAEILRSRLKHRYERADIPVRFRGVRWTDIEVDERREAIEATRLWASGESKMRGLYLYGEFGRGKTMLAGAGVTQMIRATLRDVPGVKVRWVDCARLLTDLRGGFDSPSYKRGMASIERGEEGEVLVLDDIDKLTATDHQLQPLYTAINEWVNLDAPILITANRNVDDLATEFNGDAGKFGDAIASRIIGQCVDVHVPGRDRRLDDPAE